MNNNFSNSRFNVDNEEGNTFMGIERLSEVFELGDTPNAVPEKEETLRKKRKRVGNLIDEAFNYCSREGGIETPSDKLELKDRENAAKGLRHYEEKRERDVLESFVGFRSAEVRRGNRARISNNQNDLNLREEDQPVNNIPGRIVNNIPQRIININAIDVDDGEDKRREEDGIVMIQNKEECYGTCGCCFNFGMEDENEDFGQVDINPVVAEKDDEIRRLKDEIKRLKEENHLMREDCINMELQISVKDDNIRSFKKEIKDLERELGIEDNETDARDEFFFKRK